MPFLQRRPSPLTIRHGRTIQTREELLRFFKDTDALDTESFGTQYDDAYVTDETALAWVKVNPDIYTFLIDRQTGKPAGYINAIPVDEELYSALRDGAIADN